MLSGVLESFIYLRKTLNVNTSKFFNVTFLTFSISNMRQCKYFHVFCDIMTKFFRGGILGAPGSGKGTLSSRVVQRFDVYHVSTGDMFRKAIEKGDSMGKLVKTYLEEGKLVPDELTLEVAIKRLQELESKSWFLDGFPRNKIQAEKLFMYYPLDLVVNLKVPVEIIVDRLKGRWIHPGSGRIYNTGYNPPKVEGKDDVTGEPLIQRPDDNPEAFVKRMESYESSMAPLVGFYKERNILKEISGSSSDQIWPILEQELLKFLKPKS